MSTSEHASDDQLMARIADGDRDAFGALYRRRRMDVYRFALHMTASTATADDVTQDVFVTLIHDAARYVPGRSGVVPWLLGIARNQARRRLDRERRSVPLSDEAGVPARHFIVDTDPLADLVRERNLDAIRQALRSLPLRYREVLVLCDLQELSYADAATAVGCAVGTVRSRLHRGRAMLAARLRVGDPRALPHMRLIGNVL
jgi:RNA polymerase sigma-70 factor (ECF subfamily)